VELKKIDIEILTDLQVLRNTENISISAVGQVLSMLRILVFTYHMSEHGELGHSSSRTKGPPVRSRKRLGNFPENDCNTFG
jgi:hypothetical protein